MSFIIHHFANKIQRIVGDYLLGSPLFIKGTNSVDTGRVENNDRFLFKGVAVTFSSTCSVLCATQRADKGEKTPFFCMCLLLEIFQSITLASNVLGHCRDLMSEEGSS